MKLLNMILKKLLWITFAYCKFSVMYASKMLVVYRKIAYDMF